MGNNCVCVKQSVAAYPTVDEWDDGDGAEEQEGECLAAKTTGKGGKGESEVQEEPVASPSPRTVKVRIKISRKDLKELMQQVAGGDEAEVHRILVTGLLAARKEDEEAEDSRWNWRPALGSIPEEDAEQ